MKKLRLGAALLLLCGVASASSPSFRQPRVAIFLSKTSYHHAWETSQLAGHGWVGIATLAGIPYDTLFVEEMPGDKELSKYSTLVFAQAALVDDATYSQIVLRLRAYLAGDHSVILDGPLAIKTRTRKNAITTFSMICSDWNTKDCGREPNTGFESLQMIIM